MYAWSQKCQEPVSQVFSPTLTSSATNGSWPSCREPSGIPTAMKPLPLGLLSQPFLFHCWQVSQIKGLMVYLRAQQSALPGKSRLVGEEGCVAPNEMLLWVKLCESLYKQLFILTWQIQSLRSVTFFKVAKCFPPRILLFPYHSKQCVFQRF